MVDRNLFNLIEQSKHVEDGLFCFGVAEEVFFDMQIKQILRYEFYSYICIYLYFWRLFRYGFIALF